MTIFKDNDRFMEILRNTRISKGVAGGLAGLALATSGLLILNKFNRLPIRDGVHNWLGFSFPDDPNFESEPLQPNLIVVTPDETHVFSRPKDVSFKGNGVKTISPGELILMRCLAENEDRFKSAVEIVGVNAGYAPVYRPMGAEAYEPAFGMSLVALRKQLPPCEE